MNIRKGTALGFAIRSSILVGIIVASAGLSRAQIFISSDTNTAIYEYNLDGSQVGTGPIISGLTQASNLAVSGNDLFIAEGSTIAEYTTSGVEISGALISGVSNPSLTISGSNLYVANSNGTVGVYGLGSTPGTLTSSNADLFSIASGELNGIAVSGTNIFVTNAATNTIGEYTTSGGTVNASLASTSNDPIQIVAQGLNLYVDEYTDGSGALSVYTLGSSPGTISSSSTLYSSLGVSDNVDGLGLVGNNLLVVKQNDATIGGGTVASYAKDGSASNGSLITGLTDPQGMAIEQSTPEPSTWAMMLGGLGLLALWRRRIARRT